MLFDCVAIKLEVGWFRSSFDLLCRVCVTVMSRVEVKVARAIYIAAC